MLILVATIMGLATAAFILIPLTRRAPAYEYDWDGTERDRSRESRRAAIDADVTRYREARRAGTVCGRCAQANPPGSRFCMDCGRALPASPARTTLEPASR
jgi:hypothetical protein